MPVLDKQLIFNVDLVQTLNILYNCFICLLTPASFPYLKAGIKNQTHKMISPKSRDICKLLYKVLEENVFNRISFNIQLCSSKILTDNRNLA